MSSPLTSNRPPIGPQAQRGHCTLPQRMRERDRAGHRVKRGVARGFSSVDGLGPGGFNLAVLEGLAWDTRPPPGGICSEPLPEKQAGRVRMEDGGGERVPVRVL
jgi:hypothetical protein